MQRNHDCEKSTGRANLPPLVPPDLVQCQAEYTDWSFMTLGPRQYFRCKNKPAFVVTENKPGEDGRIGSMSLCEGHAPKSS